MSRVDEALERAAALAGTQPGTSLMPGRDFEPASSADLWPSEGVVEEAAPPAPSIPVMQHFTGSDVPTEADEKLVSRLLDSRSVEQYRQIAARLHLSQAQHGTRVVMISSALPGEGKTLTAANIALTLSHSYKRRVLLIDGDLRRPWMHELFGVPNVTGLNDGFRTQAGQKVPLIRWSECLTLLTAGRPDSDPMGVLASDRMKQIVAEATAQEVTHYSAIGFAAYE